ncbi:hypothetical protein [Phytomonospora endophytica]|uniref:Uncharacterized protein n=1 Tax=Phytomonospora endophytica TaxID=714109 RepID=A0A841FCX7_9ACTN|nr:hypothetical protein [Phytomonospora endophytica]MBB6033654.1 hypothetical protein [Phytomonospora endophytica]GIG64830.1 hypothetical protein Pen01_11250 [Phytomonospora endophytica]
MGDDWNGDGDHAEAAEYEEAQYHEAEAYEDQQQAEDVWEDANSSYDEDVSAYV